MIPRTQSKKNLTLFLFLTVFILVLIFGVIASRFYLSYRDFFTDGDFSSSASFIVHKGETLDKISERLQQASLINDAENFRVWTKIKGKAKEMKAGEYAIPAFSSPFLIMNILTEGNVIVHKITFQEGLTTSEILDILRKETSLSGEVGEDFVLLSNGTLLPDTYHFSLGDTRESILQRMQESFTKQAEQLWSSRQSDLPFNTLFEAVILASIVEKEAALSSEKPIIASVFINRLNKGMKLQSDPTVLFALSGGKNVYPKRVLYKDLQIDSPYNTYKYPGLPPTPICNVGIDTLRAVLNPAKTDYLYFVVDANKPRSHVFASTYEEHTKNVNNFHKKRNAENRKIKAASQRKTAANKTASSETKTKSPKNPIKTSQTKNKTAHTQNTTAIVDKKESNKQQPTENISASGSKAVTEGNTKSIIKTTVPSSTTAEVKTAS